MKKLPVVREGLRQTTLPNIAVASQPMYYASLPQTSRQRHRLYTGRTGMDSDKKETMNQF